MKWIPWIAIAIYIIAILLMLFLGNNAKGKSENNSKTEKNPIIFSFYGVYIFVAILFGLIIYKIADIQYVKGDKLRALAEKRITAPDTIQPKRGNILSHDGRLLSSALPTYLLYIDLKVPALSVVNKDTKKTYFDEHVGELAKALAGQFKDKDAKTYEKELRDAFKKACKSNKASYRHLIYGKRISHIDLLKVKEFPILKRGQIQGGFIAVPSISRVRPFGTLAARTIGDVYKVSQTGKNGLELEYDSLLKGEYGIYVRRKKAGRNTDIIIKEPINGYDIVSTIDIDLQETAERELRYQLERVEAKEGTVVLMEVKTGKVRAISNLIRDKKDGKYYESRNLAINNHIEPGSTFKTLSFLVAMDDGHITDSTKVDTEDGSCVFANSLMKDHNFRGKGGSGGFGVASVATVMHQSSNVGVSKIIDKYYGENPQVFIDGLKRCGITDTFHLEIPGYRIPSIKNTDSKYWSKTSLPWMSIGYEVQIAPIYTLMIYNAIANDGCMVKPLFTEGYQRSGVMIDTTKVEVIREKIYSDKALNYMRGILEGVVTKGTAKAIKSNLFSIAGKTGTSQIFENGSNLNKDGRKRHQITFAGYFPADKPMYSCIVYVREPKTGGAGTVCGPVFKTLAEKAYIINNGQYDDSLKLKEDWTLDSAIEYSNENELEIIEDTLDDNIMPDLIGINMEDAIFILENKGFKVNYEGFGRVIAQSIASGTELQEKNNITLTLH
jgi:cell division protein FtsI (penicillin-binding protein 3)